jgi:ATP-dependent Clp protease ATP-binding subunit ClpB
MEKHSVARLIGAPPGYVGYEQGGQLTEAVRRRPYSVVLFDEVEKAHPEVLNTLLQVMDDGVLTDSQGRKVDFRNTVIIMTSNVGARFISESSIGDDGELSTSAREAVMSEVRSYFKPEFINRIDEIITFRSLDENDFAKIAVIMLDELSEALAEKGITLKVGDGVDSYIARKSFSNKFGARNMRRFIQTDIEDRLAEYIISNYNRSIASVELTVNDDILGINCK